MFTKSFFPATYGMSTDSFVGIQASYYAFAALRNSVKWCTIMFSSVSGVPDFSPKSVTLPPIATRVSYFFPLVSLEMSLFPRIFCTHFAVCSLYREYVVRYFLPDGVFLPCEPRAGFFTSAYYVRIQSINQLPTLYYCCTVVCKIQHSIPCSSLSTLINRKWAKSAFSY